jgi:L,D-transpeptidase catalytic domain
MAELQFRSGAFANDFTPYVAGWRMKGPLQIIVSIADQRISVYDDGTLIARSSVSTGVQGHPTPVGVFSVTGKELWHQSNIYSAAPMPYMQRITWSGIALHAGVLPGHPASHGCIRLAKDFAVRLWHLTKRGVTERLRFTRREANRESKVGGVLAFQRGATRRLAAIVTRSARESASIFRITLPRCAFTVISLMPSSNPTC